MQLVATPSTLREVFQNDVKLPDVPIDDVMAALDELGLDRLGGAAPVVVFLPCPAKSPTCVETRLSLCHRWADAIYCGLYADWVQLSDAMFQDACEQLGQAIRCPLKIGFRNRLRKKTQPTPAPAQLPGQVPPPPQYASLMGASPHLNTGPSTTQVGESMSEHMPTAPRSTVMHGGLPPHATSYAPPHSSGQRADVRSGTGQAAPHAREAASTVEPTLASAKRLKFTSPLATTVPVVAAAKASGTTCDGTS